MGVDYFQFLSRHIFSPSLHQKEEPVMMMKPVVFMMCLLVTALAAPAPGSESDEQVAAHANEALRWMEMYRLYQQQGLVGNPFVAAADTPADAAVGAAVDTAPAQPAYVPPPAAPAAPVEDASEEEDGNAARNAALGAPLNSDEEETEEVEVAEVEPAVVEEAPAEPAAGPGADPAADVETAVVDVPIDVAPVDAIAAVDLPPVDMVAFDHAPAALEVSVDVAVADVTAAAVAADAALLPAETDTTGVIAYPAVPL